ncbi:MAG: selenocysteine-specific translation elongation factor [Acidimicrobiales bacterium]
MTVIATAGHVDHGKSTLVEALTGTDPDRWAEEKARGLTIDLGFAALDLGDGTTISLVDVPGHIRFLRNMLAGVGAVDGCLFVVDAAEGWKPQSEEHLRILDLLGLRRGVIALTKVDTVDDDLLELAELDVSEHVEGTFLDGAPIIGVSAHTGDGLGALRAALAELVAQADDDRARTPARLWVDRAFSAAGAGTVVTGTLTGADLTVGDEVTLHPSGGKARVRALQSHHRELAVAAPGSRVAVNLGGINHADIERGDALALPATWWETCVIDASLTVLETLGHDVSRRGAYAAYIGSAERMVRLRVLGPDTLAPGATGQVRLRLDRPVPALPGDRFVLRDHGRDETVGGGEFLDVDPVLAPADARPQRSADRVVAERGWVDVDTLRLLTGETLLATVGRWLVAPDALASSRSSIRERVASAGSLGLDIAMLDERERALLSGFDDLHVDNGRVTIGIPKDPFADHPWLALLDAEPFAPPGPDGVDPAEVRELVRRGLVMEQDRVYFSQRAVGDAAVALAGAMAATPEGLTVSQIREVWGTSRKYALALLAHFDGTGQTRRRDDLRIAGPRLPRPI